jgi:hypothetical protein
MYLVSEIDLTGLEVIRKVDTFLVWLLPLVVGEIITESSVTIDSPNFQC